MARLHEDSYLLVVNASNREKLLPWFREHLNAGIQLEDRTFETGMVAIQGPDSLRVMEQVLNESFGGLDYYHIRALNDNMYVSRTGYTGEDGFEIIASAERIKSVWKKAREAGAEPVGLGARDSLRLEMGFALYGHELTEEISPLQAGLGWLTHLDKGEFIGREALLRQKQDGKPMKRVNFIVEGQGIPRQGYTLHDETREIGIVSSGGFSPILSKGIGLGFVEEQHRKEDSLYVDIRGKKVPVRKTKPPFVEKKVKS